MTKAFSVARPVMWNSLPAAVRYADSLRSFKRRLRLHFVSSRFNGWQCNALQVRLHAWRALNYHLLLLSLVCAECYMYLSVFFFIFVTFWPREWPFDFLSDLWPCLCIFSLSMSTELWTRCRNAVTVMICRWSSPALTLLVTFWPTQWPFDLVCILYCCLCLQNCGLAARMLSL